MGDEAEVVQCPLCAVCTSRKLIARIKCTTYADDVTELCQYRAKYSKQSAYSTYALIVFLDINRDEIKLKKTKPISIN